MTRVDVTVEGNPNDIYSTGLAKRDMYREAIRFFSNTECEKYLGTNCVSRRKYYTDKFACVIDFRTVDDDTVSGSGRKLVGTQACRNLNGNRKRSDHDGLILPRLHHCRCNHQYHWNQNKRNGRLLKDERTISHDYRRNDGVWENVLPPGNVRTRLQKRLRLYFHRVSDI